MMWCCVVIEKGGGGGGGARAGQCKGDNYHDDSKADENRFKVKS